jgi:hypothetical protein
VHYITDNLASRQDKVQGHFYLIVCKTVVGARYWDKRQMFPNLSKSVINSMLQKNAVQSKDQHDSKDVASKSKLQKDT